MANATLNRFFSLHFVLPFLLAALALAHLIALHQDGSNNPNGIGSNGDRYPMHPYFTFKLRRLDMFTHPYEQGRSCVKGSGTTYLGRWGNSMPNRACMQKVIKFAKQLAIRRSVQLDTVRAILHKFQFSFHPRKGGYLNCKEIFQSIFRVGFEGSEFTHRLGSYTKSIIKKMSGKPKSKSSRSHVNSGTAKARNSYAVRGLGVAVIRYGVLNGTRSTITTSLRSSPVLNLLRSHSTGTGSSINVLSRLNDLQNRSKKYNYIDRDLYKTFILNKDMLLLAYNRLKFKTGMRIDDLSSDFISTLITELRSESFSFSDSLTTDMVQEVMRLVLEAIYEPIFNKTSYRECHTALRYVFTKFKGCTW